MQRLLSPLYGRSPESSTSPTIPQSPTFPPVSPSLASSDHECLREERPGYFPDIGAFLKYSDLSNADLSFEPTWRNGRQAMVAPRTIIYVRDMSTSTRLNDRVMLVLRKTIDTGFTLTCLSFCKHTDLRIQRLSKTHRQVKSSTQATRISTAPARTQVPIVNNGQETGTKLQSVEVDLFHGRNIALSPQDDITLNCEELWNVELNVAIAVLGEVTPSSFKDVVGHVKQLFWDALDQAVNEDTGSAIVNHNQALLNSPSPAIAIVQPNKSRNQDRQGARSDGKTADRQGDRRDDLKRQHSGRHRRDSNGDSKSTTYRVEYDWRGNKRLVEKQR